MTIHTRTFSWTEPEDVQKLAQTMTGLEFIQAICNGDLPPPAIADLMDIKMTKVEKGRVVFTVVPQAFHYNPLGTVHGGLAATICDSAMACAVQTMLPVGVLYTTVELSINYVRAITEKTGELHCIGKIVHSGRKIATADCRLVDANDKLYAHGTTTCVVLG